MKARHPSWCSLCGQPIEVGDFIRRSGRSSWVHDGCPAKLEAPAENPVNNTPLIARYDKDKGGVVLYRSGDKDNPVAFIPDTSLRILGFDKERFAR